MTPLPPPIGRKGVEDEKEEIQDVILNDDYDNIVEQMPELIGGMNALFRNMSYPETAIRSGIEG